MKMVSVVVVMPLLLPLIVPATTARAGELDLNLGVQATTTPWPGDHGGGATLEVGYWFLPWLGASFLGKEQYAHVDSRYMSYFSLNGEVRQVIGSLRLTGSLGVVHQHEESGSAVMEQPVQSLFGVGDGIRHRMAGRTGVQLALPFHHYSRGAWYAALDIDGTMFMDTDRGPRWMASAGLSLGFSFDVSHATASTAK